MAFPGNIIHTEIESGEELLLSQAHFQKISYLSVGTILEPGFAI